MKLELDTVLSSLSLDQKVETIEKIMLQQEQVMCPVIHHFGPGVYLREVTLPTDSYVIGHRHKHDHMNILLKGKITILGIDSDPVTYVAPMIVVSPPGRKVAYVHEETTWINVYSEDERDIEKLEEKLLDKSLVWQEYNNELKLLEAKVHNTGFEEFLQVLGTTDEVITQLSEREDDMIDMPDGSWAFAKGDSSIHGKGMFATAEIKQHTEIGPARIRDKRTPLGRWVNHSNTPNAIPIVVNDTIILVALKDIQGSRGGSLGEEILIDYTHAILASRSLLCQQ